MERRENLLEDQSELNLFKGGIATATELFDYYLGYLKNATITPHFQTIADSAVEFAKQWGMNVAVHDLHTVIAAAKRLGGKVVLGGHSLGGSVVTAYASWDFKGRAGADDWPASSPSDGGSQPSAEERRGGDPDLAVTRCAEHVPPWLSFGGISAPYAGLFNATGSGQAALQEPDLPRSEKRRGSCPPTSSPRSRSPTSASTATPSTRRRRL